MPADKKRKKGESPYLTSAQKAEREEFEKRRRRILIYLIIGLPIVLILMYWLTTPPVYVD